MRKIILFFLLFISTAYADTRTDTPSILIGDIDGTNAGRYRSLKFSNGSTTNNADGSISVTTGGGGGGSGTVSSGTARAFAYYPASNTTVDDATTLFTDGTSVGVGISAPTVKLDVVGSIKSSINVSTVDQVYGSSWDGDTNVPTKNAVYDKVETIGGASGWTDDGTAVRLTTATDSVGIGITGPRTKLEIAGTISIIHGGDNGGRLGVGTTAPRTALETQGTISIIHGGDNGGRLGIGTTAPSASLTVLSTGSNTGAQVLLVGTSAGAPGITVRNDGNVAIGTTAFSNGNLNVGGTFQVNVAAGTIGRLGNAAVTVSSNQFSGAASGAAVTFQNSSATSASSTLVIGAVATNGALNLRSTSGTGSGDTVKIQTGTNGSNEALRAITSGFVAIGGTTPRVQLEVAGTVAIIHGGSAAGQLGIGTTAPTASLDVRGAGTFTGTIRSTATADIGWGVVAGANTACNTTCTNACVFGEDTGVVGTIVGCADATADVCVCAGSI